DRGGRGPALHRQEADRARERGRRARRPVGARRGGRGPAGGGGWLARPRPGQTRPRAPPPPARAPRASAGENERRREPATAGRGLAGRGPAHLRDASYRGAARVGHGQGYQYPHDAADGVIAQQYVPDALRGRRYYEPSRHGAEARYADRSERIRAILGGSAEA